MTFESARADEQSQPIRLTGRVIGRVPVLRLPDEYHVVYQDRRPVPEMSLLRDARARHPGHKVGIGTIGNFAEINRNREIAAAADVIAYAVNPQVHAMDDLSLVENLPAQGDTVRTVRSFAPRAHLHVGPITLSRQPDPFAAGNDGSAKPVELDSRSAPPLGTAWAVASLKYLAEAGADSVAYADVVLPDAIRNLAGADVLEVTDPQPLRFTALAAGDQLFVINLLNQPAAVPVNGFGAIDLPPYGIKQLRIP